MSRFKEKVEKGQIVSVSEIREVYEEAVGHKTAPAHIYVVLKRHNWTKSKHPKKASDEVLDKSH